jgi:hypothetical protein
MRRRRLVIVVGVFLVTLALAAAASASCHPARSALSGHWQDGWISTQPVGVCVTGSSANITVYSPYVYSTSTSSAWVTLQNTATGRYGQIGWLKDSNGLHNFYQSQTVGLGRQGQYWGTPTIGDAPEYKVTFSSDAFHYFLDGVNWYTDANTGFSGCDSAQAGETLNYATQMPGASNTHVDFMNASRREDTGWVDQDGSKVNSSTADYGYLKVSSHRLEIWDKACAN